jgi:drug/metabolite transporter (DMT)-like permease
MKALQIIGALLIAAGLYVLVRGASYPSDKSLFRVGDVEAKIERHHQVPPWVGGVGIAAGLVLVVVGVGKRAA